MLRVGHARHKLHDREAAQKRSRALLQSLAGAHNTAETLMPSSVVVDMNKLGWCSTAGAAYPRSNKELGWPSDMMQVKSAFALGIALRQIAILQS